MNEWKNKQMDTGHPQLFYWIFMFNTISIFNYSSIIRGKPTTQHSNRQIKINLAAFEAWFYFSNIESIWDQTRMKWRWRYLFTLDGKKNSWS